jgi:hypothetical protein
MFEYTDRGPDIGSLCSCFSCFPYATYPLGMHGVSRETKKIKFNSKWPIRHFANPDRPLANYVIFYVFHWLVQLCACAR